MMNRRTFLGTTALAASATVLSPYVARGQGQIRFQLGHGASPGNPRSVAADRFSELVKERTSGRIEVRIAGAEQLGGDAAMITAMRTGTLDMSPNTQGTASAVAPRIALFGLPFLFASMPAAHKVVDGPLGDEVAKDFEANGLILLSYWDNGIRHTTNSKRAIKSPADVRGLKIRTPADPMTIDIFQALGAATEQIKFSELYVALQQGVVDGQENPLANIFANKLHEVNPFIAMTGHKWEATPFLMSRMSWGRLNDADKKVIKDAAMEAGALQRRLLGEAEAKLLVDFKANAKVTVTEVDQKPFQAATASVYQKWEAQHGDFVRRLRQTASA